MSPSPSDSRPPAPQVTPVEHDGIRYIEDAHDDRQGDQPGGYLAAIDIKSGTRLWRLKVYEIASNPANGIAPVAIYFRAMRLGAGGDFLEIEDETGRVFRVSLGSRVVTQIAGPAASSPPKSPAKPKPMPD